MKKYINCSKITGLVVISIDKNSEALVEENLERSASGCRYCWHLGIVFAKHAASLLALGISGVSVIQCDRALAQSNIVPDNTLGAENSFVVPNFDGQANEVIGGGAIRGTNLFHSFKEFNVSQGRGAYFYSPSIDIQNILARVTGTNPSVIMGTLGTYGNSQPNLFLINPNGVIFGSNASLNVGGSFVATTANAIRLGDTGLFSASEPQTSNLLSLNPSALFFNAVASQAQIVNRSTDGLLVPNGRSLMLVGGDVRLEGGRLFALGGRAELGAVAGVGTVRLNVDGNNLRVSFPNDVARSDVSLKDGATVSVMADRGGSIAINARNLDVSQESGLFAGIETNSGSVGAQAGDITLDATEAITVGQSSWIANDVNSKGIGNGGNINIQAGSLSLSDGASLSASTSGQGDAGGVFVQVNDAISLTNANIFSNVEAGGVGNGGNINVKAGSLSLTESAQLQTLIREASDKIPAPAGRGNAGNVNIDVSDHLIVSGVNNNGVSSAIFSSVGADAVGNGGNIIIRTGSLFLTDSASLTTSTFGQGNAGGVFVQANDLVSLANSTIFTSVEAGGVGKGGDINIQAGSLSLTDGTQLLTSLQEASGRIPAGRGNAGNVTIDVRDRLTLSGGNNSGFPNAIFSSVGADAVGNGGNINIKAGSLSLTDGAQLNASTLGIGAAGNIDIDIRSRNLNLTNGGQILAQSQGTGRAGNITINVPQALNADNGQITATSTQAGGGDTTINARDIRLRNDSPITTSVFDGTGGGGNITINSKTFIALEDSDILANAERGNGGDITIKSPVFLADLFSNGKAVAVGRNPGDFSQFRGNDRVEISASSRGGISGSERFPDFTFLQNSLSPLGEEFTNPDEVIAYSCLARRNVERGSFTVTGTGGLPPTPYDSISGRYSVRDVQPLERTQSPQVARPESKDPTRDNSQPLENTSWKVGDPVQEAQEMSVTADGRIVVGTASQLAALAKAKELVCPTSRD
jgi:filamentous hemagglutinin family protein